MAQSHDARLAELVAELGGDEVRFLFRDLVEKALQELIDAELTEAIGAAPHERTETRTNQRNGSRPRVLSTPAGDVELRIPKVREGVHRTRSHWTADREERAWCSCRYPTTRPAISGRSRDGQVPRVIVSCSGLGCGPERRRGDGEAIEEDDRSEAASGAVRSAGGALGGGGGTTQRRVGTVGS